MKAISIFTLLTIVISRGLFSQTVTDIDSNIYHAVTIGTQVWMAENLKTTRYNDTTDIPLVTDKETWHNLTTPGYCWYNNEQSTYGSTYGALYNWYTVKAGKLCPAGWHVPSDSEWTILINYIGGDSVAGGKIKEPGTTHWNSPNKGATNETGFTALPAGYRYSVGSFGKVGENHFLWSATESGRSHAWARGMGYGHNGVGRIFLLKESGLSVRCVKD